MGWGHSEAKAARLDRPGLKVRAARLDRPSDASDGAGAGAGAAAGDDAAAPPAAAAAASLATDTADHGGCQLAHHCRCQPAASRRQRLTQQEDQAGAEGDHRHDRSAEDARVQLEERLGRGGRMDPQLPSDARTQRPAARQHEEQRGTHDQRVMKHNERHLCGVSRDVSLGQERSLGGAVQARQYARVGGRAAWAERERAGLRAASRLRGPSPAALDLCEGVGERERDRVRAERVLLGVREEGRGQGAKQAAREERAQGHPTPRFRRGAAPTRRAKQTGS
eukprot:scaffold105179_cov45-Phaeocystis_antarctica.AAC.1